MEYYFTSLKERATETYIYIFRKKNNIDEI